MIEIGQVAVLLKVMPESPDVNLEELKRQIKEKIPNVKDMRESPVAFGLSCIEVLVVLPDTGGITKIEKAIEDIDTVASVETGDVTLL